MAVIDDNTQYGGQSRLKISVRPGLSCLNSSCVCRGKTQVQARGDSSDSSGLVMMRRGEVEAIPEEATMVDSLFPDLHRYAHLPYPEALLQLVIYL